MKNHPVKRTLLRIAAIIAAVGLFITALFALFPGVFTVATQAFIDVALLAILSAPFIYFWVVEPFIDERNKALIRASRMAHHDTLTDLPNRRYLTNSLEKFLAEAHRHKIAGALVLLDLDGFKAINEDYGHEAGDAVLVAIAKRLQLAIRAEDIVARIGGDEFTVLVKHLNADKAIAMQEAKNIAEHLSSKVIAPIEFQGKHLIVGCSVGVTLLGHQQVGVNEAIREADLAMSRAKKAGDGGIEFMDAA